MSIYFCIKSKIFLLLKLPNSAGWTGIDAMVKDNKINKNNLLNGKLAEAEAITGRLKETLQIKSDGQIANYLGISMQNIGAAGKRDDVPAKMAR
jgi:hypothetical protein